MMKIPPDKTHKKNFKILTLQTLSIITKHVNLNWIKRTRMILKIESIQKLKMTKAQFSDAKDKMQNQMKMMIRRKMNSLNHKIQRL